MTKAQHPKPKVEGTYTPGPWHIWEERYIRDAEGLCIATVHTQADGKRNQELEPRKEANARLIAAAPELLDVLEVCALREDIMDGELGDVIRAAIAKAKGE